MTPEEWKNLNVGDVLVNISVREAYTVADSRILEDGELPVYVVSRARIIRNPAEWELWRKTVDLPK